jgi:membrane protease subunit (stomatin/prohibitin family)
MVDLGHPGLHRSESMSIWNTLKSHAKAQFLDVIQWMEDDRETVVFRYPVFNQAIQDGGKLVVRPGQSAVFVNEGQSSDSFGPGTYELNSRTKAIWSFFESIKYSLNYPYKGDIFFVSAREFSGNKWGTPQPISVMDDNFGSVEIRAHGVYTFKITDPVRFLETMVGNFGLFETHEVQKRVRDDLLMAFMEAFGQIGDVDVHKLHTSAGSVAEAAREIMDRQFQERLGISITQFTLFPNIPKEIRDYMRELDKERVQMNRLGAGIRKNADVFQAMQQHRVVGAMQTAAGNEGQGSGMMQAGMGLGVGAGMGNMMGGMMGGMTQPGAGGPPPPPPPVATSYHYAGPAGQSQGSAQDIANLVVANRTGNHQVWATGFPAWKPWRDVPEIANLVPPAAPPPPPAGADPVYHCNGPNGQSELPASPIKAMVESNPGANILVWKQGMGGWEAASGVAEIMHAGGPPPMAGGGPPPAPPI